MRALRAAAQDCGCSARCKQRQAAMVSLAPLGSSHVKWGDPKLFPRQPCGGAACSEGCHQHQKYWKHCISYHRRFSRSKDQRRTRPRRQRGWQRPRPSMSCQHSCGMIKLGKKLHERQKGQLNHQGERNGRWQERRSSRTRRHAARERRSSRTRRHAARHKGQGERSAKRRQTRRSDRKNRRARRRQLKGSGTQRSGSARVEQRGRGCTWTMGKAARDRY